MSLPVYKVGVTNDIGTHCEQYYRGSQVFFCRVYPNARNREPLLQQALRANVEFEYRRDWGIKYYEGNIIQIITFVSTFMSIE